MLKTRWIIGQVLDKIKEKMTLWMYLEKRRIQMIWYTLGQCEFFRGILEDEKGGNKEGSREGYFPHIKKDITIKSVYSLLIIDNDDILILARGE